MTLEPGDLLVDRDAGGRRPARARRRARRSRSSGIGELAGRVASDGARRDVAVRVVAAARRCARRRASRSSRPAKAPRRAVRRRLRRGRAALLRGRERRRRSVRPARSCPAPLALEAVGATRPDVRRRDPRDDDHRRARRTGRPRGASARATLHVVPFAIDAFEVTRRRRVRSRDRARADDDPRARRAGSPRDEAAAFCARRGGRLPTEDEWIVAARGRARARYPWGDTGAVCRRAAWGLATGPCAHGATGPDTVGAHPDGRHRARRPRSRGQRRGVGATSEPRAAWSAAARGRPTLATELRTWARARGRPGGARPDRRRALRVRPTSRYDAC